MLPQFQPGMATVLDEVMPVRHLPKCDLRLLLRGDRPFGRGCKQWQWFVAHRRRYRKFVNAFSAPEWISLKCKSRSSVVTLNTSGALRRFRASYDG